MSGRTKCEDTDYESSGNSDYRAPNPWPAPYAQELDIFEKLEIGRKCSLQDDPEFGLTSTSNSTKSSNRQIAAERKMKNQEISLIQFDQQSSDSDIVPYKANEKKTGKSRDSSYYGAYSYGNPTESTIRKSILDDDTPSPRGLTRDNREAYSSKTTKSTNPNNSLHISQIPRPENKLRTPLKRTARNETALQYDKKSDSDILTIETRRTVTRDGGIHFEESSSIQFPRNLPPNVQIIAAQFVPVANSSQ